MTAMTGLLVQQGRKAFKALQELRHCKEQQVHLVQLDLKEI
jgi:hypothetical protein